MPWKKTNKAILKENRESEESFHLLEQSLSLWHVSLQRKLQVGSLLTCRLLWRNNPNLTQSLKKAGADTLASLWGRCWTDTHTQDLGPLFCFAILIWIENKRKAHFNKWMHVSWRSSSGALPQRRHNEMQAPTLWYNHYTALIHQPPKHPILPASLPPFKGS